ncbi:MAG: type II secretion system protein [Proteobacteria bacterium]|jgi:prepilin-type N-terminal cleavage/methylation domain-containing protein|nr:type II secretion system protein [Alphaproteobacteria bacterium]NCC03964.1 type II secretion system protein [Pseudomonadota bacterium]
MTSKFAPKDRFKVLRQRGFSLTEFAIVLGVMGVVLSALWSFASIVREQARREETKEQLMVMVAHIRDHYLGRRCASVNTSCTNGSDLTDYLLRRNALLPEQIRNRTAGVWVADHPWGVSAAGGGALANGGLAVFAGDDTGASPDSFFTIEYRGLSRPNCIALSASLSGVGTPTGLTQVLVNGSDAAPLPVAPEVADGFCVEPAGDQNVIRLIYRLRNNG